MKRPASHSWSMLLLVEHKRDHRPSPTDPMYFMKIYRMSLQLLSFLIVWFFRHLKPFNSMFLPSPCGMFDDFLCYYILRQPSHYTLDLWFSIISSLLYHSESLSTTTFSLVNGQIWIGSLHKHCSSSWNFWIFFFTCPNTSMSQPVSLAGIELSLAPSTCMELESSFATQV